MLWPYLQQLSPVLGLFLALAVLLLSAILLLGRFSRRIRRIRRLLLLCLLAWAGLVLLNLYVDLAPLVLYLYKYLQLPILPR